MATMDSAEIAGQTPVAPVGSVAMRSLTPELREMIGDGGGSRDVGSFASDFHTSGVDMTAHGIFGSGDGEDEEPMPEGVYMIRGMITGIRTAPGASAAGVGFAYDVAVYYDDEGAPTILGTPAVTRYETELAPTFSASFTTLDDMLAVVTTSILGGEYDWKVGGTYLTSVEGDGEDGGDK